MTTAIAVSDENIRESLLDIRTSVKNASGAIESNQVVDKDVHGTLTRVLSKIDAALDTLHSAALTPHGEEAAATPAPQHLSMGSTLPQIPAQFSYTNYKGEHEVRNVYPIGLWYGSTEWHPEKQWFIHAFDIDRNGRRDFALKDIGGRDEHAA
jgi:hypothetical protein